MYKNFAHVTKQLQQIPNNSGILELNSKGYYALLNSQIEPASIRNDPAFPDKMYNIIGILRFCVEENPGFDELLDLYNQLFILFSPDNGIGPISENIRNHTFEEFSKKLQIYAYNLLFYRKLIEDSIPNYGIRNENLYHKACIVAELFRQMTAKYNRGIVANTMGYQMMKALYTYNLSPYSKALIDSLIEIYDATSVVNFIKDVQDDLNNPKNRKGFLARVFGKK